MARSLLPHVSHDSSHHRRWVYIALAVVLVVDIVLIAWALSTTRADATAEPRSIPAFEPRSPVDSTPPVELVETPIVAVPPTRIIAAFDATTAWRASTGACPVTPASPERTTNSGETWTTTDATGPTEVTALQNIMVDGAQTASMVGLGASDCTPQLVRTFVAGDNYASYPQQLGSVWFVNPADRATVHSPARDFPAPCSTVVALAPRDATSAALLCSEGNIFTTTDAASTWSEPLTVPGAVNLTATDDSYLIAGVGRPDCAGVQVLTLVADAVEATQIGCLPLVEPAESLAGDVALAEADGTLWIWAADTAARSFDRGVTWQ